MILKYLELLTKKGWWTVGSQPAVDSISSEDEILGWGPRGGYVFQKGFVEFFCDKSDVDAIEQRVEGKGQGWVHWLAGNYEVWSYGSCNDMENQLCSKQGECRGNVPEGGRNAVTWGVFPGQEIAQSTIIEKESFVSWKVMLLPPAVLHA